MSQLDYASGRGLRSERNYALSSYRRRPTLDQRRRRFRKPRSNVGNIERLMSLATGAALAAWGASRKSLPGLLVAGVGGGFVLRGVTGHCGIYDKLDIHTTQLSVGQHRKGPHPARQGVHVVESVLINKPVNELYDLWRDFENLPRIMSHLDSVRVLDEQRSHWVADAPRLVGGSVEWDAEIIRDERNTRIAWRSLPDSQIDQRGMVSFLAAPGDRGVIVRVDVEYRPPAGQLGHWVATLLGEDPGQQIHEDLRNLKQTLEIGEVVTVEGQSRGSCLDRGNQRR